MTDIHQQEVLMKHALRLIEDFRKVKEMFGGVDDKYVLQMRDKLAKEYGETMTKLCRDAFIATDCAIIQNSTL